MVTFYFQFCMKKNILTILVPALLFSIGHISLAAPIQVEKLTNRDGSSGLRVIGVGMASAEQPQPIQLEIWDNEKRLVRAFHGGYFSLAESEDTWQGTGQIKIDEGISFEFQDEWKREGNVLHLDRTVTVHGNTKGGFLSAAILRVIMPQTWPQIEWFAPGMIYGDFEFMSGDAIGGSDYYQPGAYTVRIREDRLPAPLLAALFEDGTTLAVLNPAPKGDSTAAEAMEVSFEPMTDERFAFGAIGGQERNDTISIGFWYPGTSGEQTYSRKTQYEGEKFHKWRRRFHPIKDGFQQHYQTSFRFDEADGLNTCCKKTWRWAWDTLQPKVNRQDIAAIQKYTKEVLFSAVVENEDRAGVHASLYALPNGPEPARPKTIMGFIGAALPTAKIMLEEAERDETERGKELHRKAVKIIDSFTQLKIAPPDGEGFYVDTGEPLTTRGRLKGHPEVYLRTFCSIAPVVSAYDSEKKRGYDHPRWLAWAKEFGEWLLTQQQPEGGFPRSWLPKTGEVYDPSPTSSHSAIGFLNTMYRVTKEKKYRDAALRVGEYCWNHGQAEGRFVGATIDNPNVIDKGAALTSYGSCMTLYSLTKDPKWLERAQIGADIAETWIYIWDIPMPVDVDNEELHWKRGIPTTGLQLIASGHSLVDASMAGSVGTYVSLYQRTGDKHYLDVARILLHNTKAMIQLPDRDYGLRGPGWQQEHYSLAPPRGVGRHQYWLPWVAVTQLGGIKSVQDLDKELKKSLLVDYNGGE